MLGNSWKDTSLELFYSLCVLGHLIVASNLYYGGYGGELMDHYNWDLPSLVGVLTIWLYIGVISSTCWNRWFIGHEQAIWSRISYMISITLPTLSVIFSAIGILAVALWGLTVRQDKFALVVLYALNIFFIVVLSRAIGLWPPTVPPVVDTKVSNNKSEPSLSTGSNEVKDGLMTTSSSKRNED